YAFINFMRFDLNFPHTSTGVFMNRIAVSDNRKPESIAISPDLEYVAASYKEDNSIYKVYIFTQSPDDKSNMMKVWNLITDDKPEVTITSLNHVLIRSGNVIYSYGMDKAKIFDFSMDASINDFDVTEDGEYVSMCSIGQSCSILDKAGKEILKFAGDSSKFFPDNKRILLSYKNELKQIDFSENSIFEIETPSNILSTAISSDGKRFAIATKGLATIYDSDMKIIGELPYKSSEPIVFLSTHGDGLLLAAMELGEVSQFVTSMQLLSLEDDSIVNTTKPIFEWQDVGADEYILNIDGKEISLTSTRYEPDKELDLGNHEWSVKGIFSTHDVVISSKNTKFTIVDTDREIEIVKTKENLKLEYIFGALGALVLVIGIVLRPYYKRSKLKREMSKTSTDWCPNCHKFTGGTKVCPHCGGSTMVEVDIKKMSEKIKSKKK
ncbi:MAG: hypothetical protein KAI15_07215, partial [Gammaproteobacteria bacterium]|nr:hypothetical protein [Gammaproteobacteria bacterium]